jgi:hypothetical protein
MIKTYHGSCHCGAVRFECRLDLAPEDERSPQRRPGPWYGSTFRCNCRWCAKTRFWKGFVPTENFTQTAGEDMLQEYRHGERLIRHVFCRVCGVHPFASASFEVMGGDFYAVNIACLDDAGDAELAAAPLTYEDGRNDDWSRPPAETRHL